MATPIYNIYYFDINTSTFKLYNVFDHTRVQELMASGNMVSEQDLKATLRLAFSYKAEWEFYLDAQWRNTPLEHMDGYKQIMANWDVFKKVFYAALQTPAPLH